MGCTSDSGAGVFQPRLTQYWIVHHPPGDIDVTSPSLELLMRQKGWTYSDALGLLAPA